VDTMVYRPKFHPVSWIGLDTSWYRMFLRPSPAEGNQVELSSGREPQGLQFLPIGRPSIPCSSLTSRS